MNMEAECTENYLEIIRINHDEAYLYISQGLSFQEQSQYDLACDMYKKGLEKIDKALNVRCDRSYCIGPNWDNARKLQAKMRKTSQMIKGQIQNIPSVNGHTSIAPPYTPPEPFELPPSYDEACEHDLSSSPRRSSCPGNPFDQNGSIGQETEVLEIFSVPDDVQLFFVSQDGSVSTSSTQTCLYIYQFIDHDVPVNDDYRPPAWLQVGSWTYPLIPGQSPALESAYGAFLFPNIGAGRDSAVGVVLPSTVDFEKRKQFQEILNLLTALKEEATALKKKACAVACETSSSQSFSETLSRGIVTGAEYLSAGLVKGAALSSDLLHKGAVKAKDRLRPEDYPVAVDPRVQEGLRLAREASGMALKATGYLVKKLGDLTLALGRHLAPHIREQGSKLLTTAFNRDSKEAKDTIDGILTVAAGGLQGFSTVYMGLESAARILAQSLSSETVNIVDHKYGKEAGEVVSNTVNAIGNLALTTHNVHSLGIKSVAKRTAKDTGKAVLKDYVEKSPTK